MYVSSGSKIQLAMEYVTITCYKRVEKKEDGRQGQKKNGREEEKEEGGRKEKTRDGEERMEEEGRNKEG